MNLPHRTARSNWWAQLDDAFGAGGCSILDSRRSSALALELTRRRTRQRRRRPRIAGVRGLLGPVAGAELALRHVPAQQSAMLKSPFLCLICAQQMT